MKRKIMSIIALAAVSAMTMTSLTGCGTKAEATDHEVTMGEETILVTEDESSENIIVDNGDENADAETVVAGTEEAAGDETIGGDIVFYTEWIGRFPDEPSTSFEFEPIDEEVTVEDDVIVTIGGREVGYIKGGTTIRLIEKNITGSIYRVENTSGVGYEYVYITDDDLLTLNDMKEFVARHLEGALTTIVDTPETDMEYIEFTIEKSQRSGVEDFIWESLDNENFSCYDYNTFCVECTKNGELIDCKVYYK